MSLATLPSILRNRICTSNSSPHLRRHLHTSPQHHASILFALSALSNSRETQHFSKISKLSRIEHSPPLKLIKTSEVDVYPCPERRPPAVPPHVRTVAGSRSALRIWDQKALQIGRVVLDDQARRIHRLTKSLARAKRREANQDVLVRRERAAWQQEREKMRREMRGAGVWILVSIGTATALATWRFWPEKEVSRESGDLGRKIAARAAAAMPLPAAVSVEPTMSAPAAVPVPSTHVPPAPVVQAAGNEKEFVPPPADQRATHRWWKSLFWKQQ